MYATDFEYDGRYLSDYGFSICTFDSSSGIKQVSAGSNITFNRISRHTGKIHSLAGTEYDEYITSTFDICKDPCIHDDIRMTNDEYRDVMRWLNRREFLKFQILNEDSMEFDACYYNASFNVEKLALDKSVYGLRLTMETDKPFGYGAPVVRELDFTDTSKKILIRDFSDEIGYLYPSLVITCKASGTLKIKNDATGAETYFYNVTSGEVITVNGSTMVVTTSVASKNIYDNFNFEFLKICNTLDSRDNYLSVSLPCSIKISYSPIIKDTPNE